MAVLDANLTAQLQTLLQRVTEPVVLASTLDERPKSADMAALLDEIAALSDRVTHERRDETGVRAPSFAVERPGSPIAIRFAGIPLGHEFSSLVLALLQVGGVPPKVDADVADAVRALPGGDFVTYMSLTCQNCPTVVQAFNTMAVLNPAIRHTVVEGSLFQDEIDERQIMSVPTVYADGELFGAGRMDVPEIVGKLDTGSQARTAAKLADAAPYDVLVVGGGPAGASAAIYAARKGIRTGLVADRFGGQVLDTMEIANLVSVPQTEGPKLAADLEAHVRQYEADLMTAQQAEQLVPAERPGELHQVRLSSGATLRGRSVVVATGARWRLMGVPGEQEYRNKGVTFCPHCDGPLFKGKSIAVVGGGNSGVEAAIDLAGIVGHVTLVELLDELRADDVLVRKLRSLPNVDVRTGVRTTAVEGDGSKVTGLRFEPRDGGPSEVLDVAGVFVQIGLLPNTEWVEGTLERNRMREIVTDAHGRTSVPGVFAAGDCTDTPFKQIVVALGEGSTASLSAFDHLIRTDVPAAV